MKNIKKKIKIIILIMIIVLIVIGSYIGYCIMHPIQVNEISILQYEFTIESDTFRVVIPNENKEIENESNNSENKSVSKKNSANNVINQNKNVNSKSKTTSKSSSKVTTATYTPRIQIPRTKINLIIYSDMTIKNMEKGVAILCSDNGLNQPGNTVISGHNYVNGKLFSNNDKIQLGDLVYITDSSGQKLTYSVYHKYYTNPNDADYMERDTNGATEISLTTCTPDSSQRIIIFAKQI